MEERLIGEEVAVVLERSGWRRPAPSVSNVDASGPLHGDDAPFGVAAAFMVFPRIKARLELAKFTEGIGWACQVRPSQRVEVCRPSPRGAVDPQAHCVNYVGRCWFLCRA